MSPLTPADSWPVFDLRLSCGQLALRPLRETDLGEVAAALPDDAEHDPSSTMWESLNVAENRRRLVYQNYWRDLARWRPESWTVTFHVSEVDHFVGIQALEGENFSTLRTVDSHSWLVPEVRGRGVGRAMRAAVLSLAFDHLAAEFAVSSGRDDNPSSLAVSRRLGYVDNGLSRINTPTGLATLVHLRLARATWLAAGFGADVRVENVEPCRQFFGAP